MPGKGGTAKSSGSTWFHGWSFQWCRDEANRLERNKFGFRLIAFDFRAVGHVLNSPIYEKPCCISSTFTVIQEQVKQLFYKYRDQLAKDELGRDPKDANKADPSDISPSVRKKLQHHYHGGYACLRPTMDVISMVPWH